MALLLAESQWQARRQAHEERVDAWVIPHLERRSRRIKHPVEDFLFTYYSYRPAELRRWHPGINVSLTGDVSDFAVLKGYRVREGHAEVDRDRVDGLRTQAGWIRGLLTASLRRPPMLGCFGLHEWAMVYRQAPAERRHPAYPLRLGTVGTDAVADSHRIRCTHFDAFRFFSDPARRLNAAQPTRESQHSSEQPGCLHAAMDCYKWAYRLAPLTCSELVADCFELAREVREVDMRASPYDLDTIGLDPIEIETSQGKAIYVAHQRDFAARSDVLRARLLEVCGAVLDESAEPLASLVL